MSELKRQTVSGAKWLTFSGFLQKGIQMAGTIVLARILSPAEFGLFALAFIAIDALTLFKSMGFDSALVQRRDNFERAANTAFFIIPLLGLILYFILFLSAPLVGRFMNNQEVIGPIKALGIIFIISCLGKVPLVIIERNMQFKQASIIEIIVALVYSATAIILAILGMNVWSLVIAYILKTIIQNIIFWRISGWRPRLEFDKKIALEMFHFGKFLLLGGFIWFFKSNLDNLLVGKLLGVTALGLYAIAFNIANFGADYFGGRIYRVTFPAYSKLQTDLYDLRNAALKVLKHVSLFALPLGIGLFLLNKEFLRFVYGDKWVGATNVLKILAWAGIFNTLPAGLGGIFMACGKPKIGFWITSLQVAIFFAFITPMAKLFGLNGVGMVVSISAFTAFLISITSAKKILSMNIREIYLSLRPALFSSMWMGIGIILLKNLFLQYKVDFTYFYSFIIYAIFALAIYTFSLFKFERRVFKEIKEVIS